MANTTQVSNGNAVQVLANTTQVPNGTVLQLTNTTLVPNGTTVQVVQVTPVLSHDEERGISGVSGKYLIFIKVLFCPNI